MAFALLAVPAFAVNASVSGSVQYTLASNIKPIYVVAGNSNSFSYDLSATIDKKWTLSFGFAPDNSSVLFSPASVEKVTIQYSDKNFNFVAYRNPGGSVGELSSPFGVLAFPVPWGDPNGYLFRGYAKPFGVEIDYQLINSGWYASEMNGIYLRGKKKFGDTKVTLSGRTIVGSEGNKYQMALDASIPVGKFTLTPAVGFTQRIAPTENKVFAVGFAGPVNKDLELNVSTHFRQKNFDSRGYSSDYSEQIATATWLKKLRVSADLVGPMTDLKNRKLTLSTEWRSSPASNDFGDQFKADKYFNNKGYGLNLTYTRDKKGEADQARNVLNLKATSVVVDKKAWVLGTATLTSDKDYLEKGLYNSMVRFDTGLNARAKLLPELTMDAFFNYGSNPDSKVGSSPVKVESASTGISAKYDLSKVISVGAKFDLASTRFGTGNAVTRTIGANWLLKTSDNASLDVVYTLAQKLLQEEPLNHSVVATIKLKF